MFNLKIKYYGVAGVHFIGRYKKRPASERIRGWHSLLIVIVEL